MAAEQARGGCPDGPVPLGIGLPLAPSGQHRQQQHISTEQLRCNARQSTAKLSNQAPALSALPARQQHQFILCTQCPPPINSFACSSGRAGVGHHGGPSQEDRAGYSGDWPQTMADGRMQRPFCCIFLPAISFAFRRK